MSLPGGADLPIHTRIAEQPAEVAVRRRRARSRSSAVRLYAGRSRPWRAPQRVGDASEAAMRELWA